MLQLIGRAYPYNFALLMKVTCLINLRNSTILYAMINYFEILTHCCNLFFKICSVFSEFLTQIRYYLPNDMLLFLSIH